MPQPNAQNATAAAAEFLTRCFSPGETIALLLRREVPSATVQRIVQLETARAPRYLGWLAHENHAGANVYVAANPILPGSRKRTKESIASVRHVYLDIDEDGEASLAALRASDAVPSASAILSTSPGKYQVFWRVDGFGFEEQELTLKRLAIAFGGDPACTDCNRVLRIPGFLNRKYSPAHSVTVEYGSNQAWEPADFRLDGVADMAALPLRGVARSTPHKDTRSEQDWAWVCAQLAQGRDAGKLTHELASRRADKPKPLYYAQRTVDVASARQWFLDGAPTDDVITMLADRRRFEFPGALCFARACEIATTAQRMVARRKIA
jgi:RepB DNA-primase from phage plasmid